MSHVKDLRNTYKWQTTRRKHRKAHPPDEHGNYICGLCPKPITPNQLVTIDHIIEAADDPTLFFALSNLQDAHDWCNKDKSRAKENPLGNYLPDSKWRDMKNQAILNASRTSNKRKATPNGSTQI